MLTESADNDGARSAPPLNDRGYLLESSLASIMTEYA